VGCEHRAAPGFWRMLKRDLEAGIVPQAVGVKTVFMARGNPQDRQADDVVRTVLNPGRITRIRHAGRQTTGRTSLALDRAQQDRTGIRAEGRTIKSRQDRLGIER